MQLRRLIAGIAVGTLVGLLAAQMLVLVASGAGATGTWSSTNCNGTSWGLTWRSRTQAQSYAAEADREGYEWGGGCYKLNNIDDTPGQPDSGGEGADCSGFVFKTWTMKNTYGSSGFRFWEHEKEVHGPYSTASYISCTTCPFKLLNSKSYDATAYMDAFVYNSGSGGHTGMIYMEGTDGFDYIIEAKSDDLGTRISYTDYRSQSAYRAMARKSWMPDCYPRCT
jgi:hypothetical protein